MTKVIADASIVVPKSKTTKRSDIVYPQIIEIKPFYSITDANANTKNYAVMDDIANEYNTSIVNIKRQIDGENVKILNGIMINKEGAPYVISYNDQIYECRTLKEIKEITGISVTKIHNLIKKFLEDGKEK